MKIFADKFFQIYDPSLGESKRWYVNDHTIVKGEDAWHLFGITHEEPAVPLEEILCAHAVSEDVLHQPFQKSPISFSARKEYQESHFWAPHIIKFEEMYYMFYCAGSLEGNDKYRIHLATSKNLVDWQRHPKKPLIVDGFDARDPMVLRIGEEWVMYYTCTVEPKGGNHCVSCAVSTDLVTWTKKCNVFTSTVQGTIGGPCESPFVEKVNDTYFLFIGPYREYADTVVYASKDPFCFGGEPLGRIPCHAAEILKINDAYYITHCGWGEGGVYLAPLHFEF